MVFAAFRGPGRVPDVFMRDGTAYNARNYLFFRVLFHLKNSKKSPSELLARPPAGWRIIFAITFWAIFPKITSCYTYVTLVPKWGILAYFGTSGTKVGHGVILGKIAQKVIANMILHPAGGLASSSEGVWTLL